MDDPRKPEDRGRRTTAIEYGMVAALISVAAISTLSTLGIELNDTYRRHAGTGAGQD